MRCHTGKVWENAGQLRVLETGFQCLKTTGLGKEVLSRPHLAVVGRGLNLESEDLLLSSIIHWPRVYGLETEFS